MWLLFTVTHAQVKPMDADTLDKHIQALTAQLPFRAQSVGATLQSVLGPAEGSNPWFEVSTAMPAGPFSKVEVREPTDASTADGKGGMVLLDLEDEPCLQASMLSRAFGPFADLGPAPAHPDAGNPPVYQKVKRPWGELRLGFSRQTGCLVTVVLDAN